MKPISGWLAYGAFVALSACGLFALISPAIGNTLAVILSVAFGSFMLYAGLEGIHN